MKRQIIQIDDDLCNGCGDCVPSCAEGAIQIIDGKARLMDDALCDGLGACLGDYPEGALLVIERDADAFDEERVEQHLIQLGAGGGGHVATPPPRTQAPPTDEAPAHPLRAALGLGGPPAGGSHAGGPGSPVGGGCPGSRTLQYDDEPAAGAADEAGTRTSQLRQWPVQLHLVSPMAPYFQGADVLLCADCVPFAVADFHRDHLVDRSLAIACPKLDDGQQAYVDKLVAMIDQARINTLTVMIMQVPCCGGLLQLAKQAVQAAQRNVPIKLQVVGLRGEILSEDWT